MPEDQQPNQNQPPKSIDGVKPAPRLSGENQHQHLQEAPADQPAQQQAVDSVKPSPQPQSGQQPVQLPPLQADDQLKQPPQDSDQTQEPVAPQQNKKPVREKPPRGSFPYVAVTLAVIISGGLIGLAIYLQLNS